MKKITEAQKIAVRRHGIELLGKLDVTCLSELNPDGLSWRKLCDAEAELKRHGAALSDKITADLKPDQMRILEEAFSGILATLDAISETKDARAKAGVKEPADMNRADPRRPILGLGMVASGADDGQQSRDFDPDEAQDGFALTPERRMTHWAEARQVDTFAGLTLGAYLRSMVTGANTEVERRALAAGTDSAGGFTTPDVLSAEMIDLMRANSVLSAAGARTVPLTSDRNSIAAVASDPVPGWRLENAAVAESDPTFRNVVLVPRTLAVMVKVPVELLEDSLNLQTELPRIMAEALAAELDRVGLMGTGVAPQPLGVNATPGVLTTALGAALASYAPLITARTALLTANSNITGYIMHPRDEGKLAGLLDSTGQPVAPPQKIAQLRMLTTTIIPTNLGAGTNESIIFAGNWSDMLIGVRSSIRVEVVRNAFMGNLQYGFVAYMRADFALRQPTSFHKTTGVRP